MNHANRGSAGLFILRFIGGIIEGVNVLNHSHAWVLPALAVCWGPVAAVGINRNATFTISGQDDAIPILGDSSNAAAWMWVIDILVAAGMVCFGISSPL